MAAAAKGFGMQAGLSEGHVAAPAASVMPDDMPTKKGL